MPQCKKCASVFPNLVKIEGKWRSIRRRSYCLTCSPFGARNRLRLENYQESENVITKRCTVCDLWLPLSKFDKRYDRNVRSSRCKPCLNHLKKNIASEIKDRAIAYKGSQCHDCHQSFHRSIYEFHHRDPAQKDFEISQRKTLKAWKVIVTELDKCDMLCANCHRFRHYGQS